MAMQHLENELRRTGDPRDLERADIIASMLKSRGSDVPLSPATTSLEVQSVQTLELEQRVFYSLDQLVIPYTGKEADIEAPQEVLDVLRLWQEKGVTNFDVYHLKEHTFDQNGNYSGWNTKPEDWFWRQIREGRISPDAAKLDDMWVAIDRTQKPNYDGGRQLYANDPYRSILEKLRKENKITVPREYINVSNSSRYAISHDELTEAVLPEIANLLEVESSQVRLPKEIESNLIGNRSHPEWGQTDTWEWFNDKFGDDDRLVGGNSAYGGLADVHCNGARLRHGYIGFRPLVALSKA